MKFSFPFQRWISSIVSLLLILPALTVSAGASPTTPTLEPDKSLINILLIGQDQREEDSTARADSIILCSFYPEERQIIITSFLRDLYLPIPGHTDNRLNAAYAFGGMELLRQTIEDNFDISIDGCFEADFSHFPQIIDTLGGVTIDLRQDEAEAINKRVDSALTEGIHCLTGEQALVYSRIRNLDLDGDLSRTTRQRKLITSLLNSYRNADLLTILSAVVDMLPMITTDLGKRQILVLAAKLFPLLETPAITSQRLPADGSYACEKIRGMDVLTADLELLRQQLHQSLSAINEIRN